MSEPLFSSEMAKIISPRQRLFFKKNLIFGIFLEQFSLSH